MSSKSLSTEERLPFRKGLRQLIVFQFKLLVDAARDLLFSPLSVFAFMIDAVTNPTLKNSMSYKLLEMGRRSDRVINLFDEYTDAGGYTVDQTVAEVEVLVQRELQKEQQRRRERGKAGG